MKKVINSVSTVILLALPLSLSALFLMFFKSLEIYSETFSYVFIKAAIYTAVSFILCLGLTRLSLKHILSFKIVVVLSLINLILFVLTFVFGSSINGAKTFLDLGLFAVNPSWFIPITLTLLMANIIYLIKVYTQEHSVKITFKLLAMVALFVLLFIKVALNLYIFIFLLFRLDEIDRLGYWLSFSPNTTFISILAERYGLFAFGLLLIHAIFIAMLFIKLLLAKRKIKKVLIMTVLIYFLLRVVLHFLSNMGIVDWDTSLPFMDYSMGILLADYILLGFTFLKETKGKKKNS